MGLSYEIQNHIETDRYDTIDQLYKRAAQIGNVIGKEATPVSNVVTSTFCINSKSVKVLFDFGVPYSFVSKSRIKDLGLKNPVKTSFSVAIPYGETFHYNLLFCKVLVRIGNTKFLSDFFSLEIDDLDVILGMDWLGK